MSRKWKCIMSQDIEGLITWGQLEEFLEEVIDSFEPSAEMSIVRSTVGGHRLSAQVIPGSRLVRVSLVKDQDKKGNDQ